MAQIEQILNEIEKRRSELKGVLNSHYSVETESRLSELERTSTVITSLLHNKQEPASEDLEEAANNLSKIYAGEGCVDPKREGFAFYVGFKNGAKWQKEQLIKGAVEGVVIKPDYEAKGTTKSTRFQVDDDVISTIYDKGDRVKLIILKDKVL